MNWLIQSLIVRKLACDMSMLSCSGLKDLLLMSFVFPGKRKHRKVERKLVPAPWRGTEADRKAPLGT